jgi:peptidoglycan/LPS O-acetylase OafA/YrhL
MANSASIEIAGTSRLVSLDLLRLLAIVLVLGRHMEKPPTNLPGPVQAGFDAWMNYGGLGVDLFFVLSGFLVSGLLFGEFKKYGDLSIKRFYLRRAWKIYPAFYFLLVFAYLFQLLVVGEKMRDRPAFTELMFIQSYQQGFWNHSWTLAVEEHFYVLLPLLLLFLVRRKPGSENPFRPLPMIVAGTAVLVLGVRIVNFWVRDEYSYHTHVFPSHLRIDSLFFGVAIGYAYHFHGEWFARTFRPWRYALIVAGLALLFAFAVTGMPSSFYIHTFGFAQNYLGAAALLVGMLMCRIPNNWPTNSLATVGAFSYSIYLWHMALMYWAIPHLRDAGVGWQVRTAIYMAGAFAIGIAMAKLLELPVLKFRDRKYPSRSAALTTGDRPGTIDDSPQRIAA